MTTTEFRTPFDEEPRWMTVAEAARRLGMSQTTLYDYRYKGRGPKSFKLPGGHRNGGRVRYWSPDVDRWAMGLDAENEPT